MLIRAHMYLVHQSFFRKCVRSEVWRVRRRWTLGFAKSLSGRFPRQLQLRERRRISFSVALRCYKSTTAIPNAAYRSCTTPTTLHKVAQSEPSTNKKLGGTHPTEPSEPRSSTSKAPDNQQTCLSAAVDVVASEATVAVEVAAAAGVDSSPTAHLQLCSVCASKLQCSFFARIE